MSAQTTAQFVFDALTMALGRRGRPKELLHHSDRAVSTPRKTSNVCPHTTASRAAWVAKVIAGTRGGGKALRESQEGAG